MNIETLLLRQVHPSFLQDGEITSQVFRPTPKDENLLSAYDGDKISPEGAWRHYTEGTENRSAGVMAITKAACDIHQLPVIDDGIPYPEHVSIDFTGKSKTVIGIIAKALKHAAVERGWLYRAEGLA